MSPRRFAFFASAAIGADGGLRALVAIALRLEGAEHGQHLFQHRHGQIAVSYTHLDVYKRQMFVLDRDAAIGTDGAQLAKEIVENELVMDTDVYKDGHIVYLANPTVWYTAEGRCV